MTPHSPVLKQGSALIIALWTIALLSMLVMSFAVDAQLEARIGNYVRQRHRVNYLTQSGIAITEMLLLKMPNVSAASAADEKEDRWKEPALRLKRGQALTVEEHLEEGVIRIEIIPEEARWNINLLCTSGVKNTSPTSKKSATANTMSYDSDKVWETIFTVAGYPDPTYWGELIDAWNDWADEDSTVWGRSGAEDEYYTNLEPPYRPRNGPIDNIDELRLVKGFLPVVLDGGCLNPEEKREEQRIYVKGIKELFTTYGNGKINVNAAPMEVLMTIPGMDEITAGATIEEREGQNSGMYGPRGASAVSSKKSTSRSSDSTAEEIEDYSFKNEADFMSRVMIKDTTIEQYITTQSTTFRVIIEGRAAGIAHAIQAIAILDGEKIRYLRWREDP